MLKIEVTLTLQRNANSEYSHYFYRLANDDFIEPNKLTTVVRLQQANEDRRNDANSLIASIRQSMAKMCLLPQESVQISHPSLMIFVLRFVPSVIDRANRSSAAGFLFYTYTHAYDTTG